MSNTSQTPLRLQPAPDSATVEMLHQLFGDVLIPLEKLRVHYFKNLNEKTFIEAINAGRIQLPVTTLDHSAKALRYAHIKHVAVAEKLRLAADTFRAVRSEIHATQALALRDKALSMAALMDPFTLEDAA